CGSNRRLAHPAVLELPRVPRQPPVRRQARSRSRVMSAQWGSVSCWLPWSSSLDTAATQPGAQMVKFGFEFVDAAQQPQGHCHAGPVQVEVVAQAAGGTRHGYAMNLEGIMLRIP